MRVLVVTNMYLSGNGNWVAEQVASLRAIGLDVDVIFFDTQKTRLHYGLSFPRMVRAVAMGKHDILHTHHTYTLILVELARKLTGSRIPVVLTNHEPEAMDREGKTRTWHPTSHLRHSLRVKRFAARRADFVIYVSRQLSDALSVNGRQAIIPCGVDLERFKPLDQRQCRQQLGIPADKKVIFFPANPRNRRKRFELAQAAHGIVRNDLPSSLMLTGGGISADMMPLWYNAADVVLQTSFCEASPTVVKEALACEVPVISTDAGDTRDVVHGVPHCWVCSDDPRELATRILEASSHRAVGARKHLLEKELSLEQTGRRVMQVYQRVLGG